MLKNRQIIMLGLLACVSTATLADSSFKKLKDSTCPEVVTTSADALFGVGIW